MRAVCKRNEACLSVVTVFLFVARSSVENRTVWQKTISRDIAFFGDPVRPDLKRSKPDHLTGEVFRYTQRVIVVFVLGVILPALAILSYLILNSESFR